MKKIIIFLLLLSTFNVNAEYNGIYFEVKVQMNNGVEIHGYRFIAHASDDAESIAKLEGNPEILLQNAYTFEPGEFGLYKDKLEYTPEEQTYYRLINPFEIDIESVKSIKILSTTAGSYATQIDGDYTLKDLEWMISVPIAKYSIGDEMCDSEIFIHQTMVTPLEDVELISQIILEAQNKIDAEREQFYKVNNRTEESYESLNNRISEIESERADQLRIVFNKLNAFKTVMITTCTC